MITTTNGKLSIMEFDIPWEPGLPMSPGSLGQEDRQQLIHGFNEILWIEQIPAAIRIHAYRSPYNYGYNSPYNYGYR